MKLLFRLFQRFFSPFILDNYEEITLTGPTKSMVVRAKIDTGANKTSVDKRVANEIGIDHEKNIIYHREFKSGLGKEHRPVVQVTMKIKNSSRTTEVSISNREHMKHKVIVGRKDIHHFLVRPANNEEV